jgi:hypothetical protein
VHRRQAAVGQDEAANVRELNQGADSSVGRKIRVAMVHRGALVDVMVPWCSGEGCLHRDIVSVSLVNFYIFCFQHMMLSTIDHDCFLSPKRGFLLKHEGISLLFYEMFSLVHYVSYSTCHGLAPSS